MPKKNDLKTLISPFFVGVEMYLACGLAHSSLATTEIVNVQVKDQILSSLLKANHLIAYYICGGEETFFL